MKAQNNALCAGAYVSRQSKWGMIQFHVKWYAHTRYLLVIGVICMQMDCAVDVGGSIKWGDGCKCFVCALSLHFPAHGHIRILNLHSFHLLQVAAIITYAFSEQIASLWVKCGLSKCIPTGNRNGPDSCFHPLTAELMTDTTCSNCSSIIGRTQRHLAGE